jgi:hypothetical protein
MVQARRSEAGNILTLLRPGTMDTSSSAPGPYHPTSAATVVSWSFALNALKIVLWTVIALFALSILSDDANAQVPELPSVDASVDAGGVKVGASASTGGVQVGANAGGAQVGASASTGGVQVGANAGGAQVGASASTGGVQVGANAGGAQVGASASTGGVRVEADVAGTKVRAGITTDGVRLSGPGGSPGVGASLSTNGTKVTTGSPNVDSSSPNAGLAPVMGDVQGSWLPPAPQGGALSTTSGSGLGTTVDPQTTAASGASGSPGLMDALTGTPGASSGQGASLAGKGPSGGPLFPGSSSPAAMPSGGSWSSGGLYAILTAALLILALGLLCGIRDDSWKPPLGPVRLLAAPG